LRLCHLESFLNHHQSTLQQRQRKTKKYYK
jgi:hypothetical protein